MLSPTAMSFLEYGNQLTNTLKENNHFGNSKKFKTLIFKLTKYRNGEDIHFDEITPAFLAAFEAYLLKLGNIVNTINCNIRTIQAIYYKAIENGYVDQSKNSFFSFKLKQGKPNKDRLNQEEIVKIEELDYSIMKSQEPLKTNRAISIHLS